MLTEFPADRTRSFIGAGLRKHHRAMILLAIPLVALPAAAPLQPNFDWIPPADRALTELGSGISVVTLSMPGNVTILTGHDGGDRG